MRKTTTIITTVLLALGLAGCGAVRNKVNEFKIDTSTVCIDGYLYAYGSISDSTFDMEPTGQFCEVTDDAA